MEQKQTLYNYARGVLVNDKNQDIIGFVSQMNGDIITTTDKFAQLFGFGKASDLLGLNVHELFVRYSNYSLGDIEKNTAQLKDGVNIIDVMVKLKLCPYLMLFSLLPIQNDSSHYEGYYAFGRQINLPSYMELILKHSKHPKLFLKKKITNIMLTEKEQVILFLLIAGFTQEEIAEYLHCSRGFIGKFIAKTICPKFGLVGSSTKLLRERAVLSGVLDSIPEKIINELQTIYF